MQSKRCLSIDENLHVSNTKDKPQPQKIINPQYLLGLNLLPIHSISAQSSCTSTYVAELLTINVNNVELKGKRSHANWDEEKGSIRSVKSI